CCDLTSSGHPCLWLLTWDPTQPIATRPLAIRKDGTWYAYGWDLTKNICEVFGPAGYIRTTYTYSPYGQVTTAGDVTQPIQWSSEVWDSEMGLVYYNWRYYNTMVGKWQSWDRLEEAESLNMYEYCLNSPLLYQDVWGMDVITYTTDETLYRQYENIIKARQAKINEVILEINEMEDCNFIELQKQRKIRYDGKVPKTKAEMTDALKKERDGLHIVHIPAKNVKDFITKLKKDAKERKLQKDDQVFVVQHGNANVRIGDERIKHAALSKQIKNVVSHAELAACEKSGTQMIKRRLWIKYELKFQKSGNSFTQWLFGYEIEQLEWSKIVGEIEESSTKKQ
ncbi:MAG: RHS repeat-associated core domain-containing protein, partial [bacterium]|nr:RHS repeat-associated core domain-containing protein [bacterium]